MAETSKTALIIVAVVAIIIIILVYLLLTKKLPISVSSSYTYSPPPPSSSYSPPSSSYSPPSSSGIQVTSFIISNGCTKAYCWGMVTFNSSITGTLTQVNTVYSNGSSYCWGGSYTVTQGTNTIWLDDITPCNHLSCNPPGQITSLVFTINGMQYTASVTPTIGNPLATIPELNSQKFEGGAC